MEPIEAIVRFMEDGEVIPLEFIWRGHSYIVESTGRRWSDPAGLHILAMVPGGKVYELLLDAKTSRWYLSPVGIERTAA
jgi:hypothetical protein